MNDPAAMADWVMNEPEVFAGYERAQAVADRLPGMARRASAAGDTAFALLLLDTLAGWTSSLLGGRGEQRLAGADPNS